MPNHQGYDKVRHKVSSQALEGVGLGMSDLQFRV